MDLNEIDMKTAEEYLEVWLGGNMNVGTLTPHAIAEFAKDYVCYVKRSEDDISKEEKIKRKENAFKLQVTIFSANYPSAMLEKFVNYWTEKNCRGKMRYEFEKTFEISKRLATWASRDKDILKAPEADQITYKEMIDRFNKGETAIQEQYEPVTPGDKRTLWRRKT